VGSYSFNQDAELAVLSILLKNPNLLFGVQAEIKDFMFTSEVNRTLFMEMINIAEETKSPPEYALLVNYLQASNRYSECGGEAYLTYLYKQTYSEESLPEFINLIRNSYKARSLVSISNEIPSMVQNEREVDQAIDVVRSRLDSLADMSGGESVINLNDALSLTYTELVDRMQNPNKILRTTGFPFIDAVTGGYWEGDVWIVAGRPGMGKSAWMCNSALNGAKAGHGQFIFSMEMQKQSLAQRLIAIESGVSIQDIRMGTLNSKDLDKVAEAIRTIKDLPIYIDTNFFADGSYITSTIRKFRKLKGIEVVHIDYIQLLVERGIYATHELGKLSRDVKLISNSLGITSVIYSQLNRGVEQRDEKRPVLSDLRQSGNLEEDTDVGLFLYRDLIYNRDTKSPDQMEHLIRKQRNGPTGVVVSKFIDATNKIVSA
jgi:replicative DNA helicase